MLTKVVPKAQSYYVIKIHNQEVEAHRHSSMTDMDYNKRGGPGDYMVFTAGGDIIDIVSEREFKEKYLVVGHEDSAP